MVLGSNKPIMFIEQIIVLALKHIISKDRKELIENDAIKNTIKKQRIERIAMQKQQQKFNCR